MSREMIYQVRVAPDRAAESVAAGLADSVLGALGQLKAFRAPSPEKSAGLERAFRQVFRRRLISHGACGSLPECRLSISVYGGEAPPLAVTHLLRLQGGLIQFVEGLSALACRRLGVRSLGRAARERLQGVLHRALSPYLYFNEECSHCPVRVGSRSPGA